MPKAIGSENFDNCLWRNLAVRYERQLDVLIMLQRIMEHFVTSHLSMPRSASHAAALITVPACIAAVADVMMRKRATDIPSEVCLHLMGQTALGQTVSTGYGVTTGHLVEQAKTIQCFQPEVAVALTAAADYFASQTELKKIYNWTRSNRLDKSTLRYFGEISRMLLL